MPVKRKAADGPLCPITDFPVDGRLSKRLKGTSSVTAKKMLNVLKKKYEWSPPVDFPEADRERVLEEYVSVLSGSGTGASPSAPSPAPSPLPVKPPPRSQTRASRVPVRAAAPSYSPPSPPPRTPGGIRSVSSVFETFSPFSASPSPAKPSPSARTRKSRSPADSPVGATRSSPRGKAAPVKKSGFKSWVLRLLLFNFFVLFVLVVLGTALMYAVHGDDAKGLVVSEMNRGTSHSMVALGFSTVRLFAKQFLPDSWVAGGALDRTIQMLESAFQAALGLLVQLLGMITAALYDAVTRASAPAAAPGAVSFSQPTPPPPPARVAEVRVEVSEPEPEPAAAHAKPAAPEEPAYNPAAVPCSDFTKYDCHAAVTDYAACERREAECSAQ